MKKNILILGITSFIGLNLSLRLNKKKYKILGITSNKINGYKNKKLKILKKNNINFLKANIFNKKTFKNIGSFDVVINCIGWTKNFNKINYDYTKIKNRYKIYFDLIKMYLINNKIPMFIELGSSNEYGLRKEKFTENSICKPKTKYGVIKKNNSLLLKKFSYQLKTTFIILRIFSLFGNFNNKGRLIEHIKSNDKLKIKNPFLKSDFISINYLIKIIKIIIKKKYKKNFNIYNCCSSIGITPVEIINLLPKEKLRNIKIKGIITRKNNIYSSRNICIGNNKKILKDLKIKKSLIFREIKQYLKN